MKDGADLIDGAARVLCGLTIRRVSIKFLLGLAEPDSITLNPSKSWFTGLLHAVRLQKESPAAFFNTRGVTTRPRQDIKPLVTDAVALPKKHYGVSRIAEAHDRMGSNLSALTIKLIG